ncbi:MAG: sensor histidine kinase [Sedimenticola sp.]|nr:sensor histidine kinase [Sedimenticola sp.]
MTSLKRQLQVGLGAGLVILFGLLWWGGIQSIHYMTDHFAASRLAHDAETVLAAMRLDESHKPVVRWRRVGAIYEQPLSGHYYQINFSDGSQVSSRSLWDQQLAIPQFTPGSQGQWRTQGPAGQELLIWVAGYNKQGKVFTLAVAEDMNPLNQQLERFEWLFVTLMLGMALLLFAIQQGIVSAALRRLDGVRQEMVRVERGDMQALGTEVPREIGPLVAGFNHLLGLFQQRLEHSRKGLGNLSHALKGPLNLLQQKVESDALKDQPALQAAMQQQVDRIRHLMEREMRRARLAGTGMAGGHFNSQQEWPALVGVLKQIHSDKVLEITGRLPERAVLPVDREDMLELLGNLLDNACKWCRGRVQCELSTQAGVTIVIEDDGPGVSGEALAQLADRGVRLDETTDGHGLGLAIVKDMVKGYGGDIQFGRSSALGGLKVVVNLPG